MKAPASEGFAYAPPPWLMAAGFLFWGWQHDQLWIAIPAAAFVEGTRWVDQRWEFSDVDFVRIWNVCMVLILGTLATNLATWGIGGLDDTFEVAMRWIPVLFLPLLFAQVYSVRGVIPLNTIAVLARRRRRLDRLAGRTLQPPVLVHLGYPYLAMLAISCGAVFSSWFLPAMLAGLLAALALQPDRPRLHPATWIVCALMVALIGFGGATGLQRVSYLLHGFSLRSKLGTRGPDAGWTHTAIGQLGRIKQSPRIDWFLRPLRGEVPKYLREASYVEYGNGNWFNRGFNIFTPLVEGPPWVMSPETPTHRLALEGQPQLAIAVIPAPYQSVGLDGLVAESLRTNQLGAVQGNAMPGVVRYEVDYRENEIGDAPPQEEDLAIPELERHVLDRLATSLWSEHDPPARRADAIARFFAEKFTYSTFQHRSGRRYHGGALAAFLLEQRSGHCEYFATASTLLLRRAGIPARYSVGYSVQEFSEPLEAWLLRGRHRHAWCQAWIDGKWTVVDNTPPDYATWEAVALTPWRRLADRVLTLRMAFTRWRQSPGGDRSILLVSWAIAALLVAYVALRTFVGKTGRAWRRGEIRNWPGQDSEFLALLDALQKRGVPAIQGWQADFDTCRDLHQRYRFDPHGLDPEDRSQLRTLSERCRGALTT